MSIRNNEPKRVVVTGVGTVSSIGSDNDTFWNSLENGLSGIDKITHFDTSDYPCHIAGEVIGFDPLDYLERKEMRHMDLFTRYAMGAGAIAVNDAKLDFSTVDSERAGVIVGSGIGGMHVFTDQIRVIDRKGPRRISPFFIPMMISDIAAGHLSIRYNLRGPNYSIASACATSGHAIGNAMKAIRYGEADICISGGAEAPICEIGLGGFCAMKALSTRNDEPKRASRPFDAERDGFVMGEGAGIIVIESLEHAEARGAEIYCELAGAGYSADAHHITAPPEDGHGAVQCMRVAIEDAGLEITDVDYINAHGTSTPLNDRAETQAIKSLFDSHSRKLKVSSTKSMHGHMLGAAGAVELIATILAIKNQKIPPTINYENPDPDCDLDYTPNTSVDFNFDVGLCNTFGFGGHNASLLVKRHLDN